MNDDELRRLEREAELDPDARVRLARALERAGRPAEAVAALVAGAGDLGVRREAARVARESAPVRTAPGVRWERTLDGRDLFVGLAASPLGVVVGSRQRTVVLDADTGVPRHEPPAGQALLADEVLLVLAADLELTGHDLWTGERLHATRIEGRIVGTQDRTGQVARHHRGLLVSAAMQAVVAYRFDDPRRAPALAWRVDVSPSMPMLSALTDELALVSLFEPRRGPAGLLALDVRDGRERFRVAEARQVHSDGRTVVATHAGDAVAYAPSGAVRWRRSDVEHVAAWTAAGLVAQERPPRPERPGSWALLDAVTGATLGPLGPTAPLLAGDTALHLGAAAVLARALDGRELWTWRAPRRARAPAGIAGLPGRLYVAMGTRGVTCIEG